jgi:hypothetical protein
LEERIKGRKVRQTSEVRLKSLVKLRKEGTQAPRMSPTLRSDVAGKQQEPEQRRKGVLKEHKDYHNESLKIMHWHTSEENGR